MATYKWDGVGLEKLIEELRRRRNGPESDRMIRAFEEALRVARIDADLLPYLLAAVVCLVARAEHSTPRHVLETFFRRSVSDEEWRERFLPLFG